MADLYNSIPEDVGWTDTDDSEVEAHTTKHANQLSEKASLEHKRSLVLAAVGLSQANSHQRKRFRS